MSLDVVGHARDVSGVRNRLWKSADVVDVIEA
jgi:hypothetical protein